MLRALKYNNDNAEKKNEVLLLKTHCQKNEAKKLKLKIKGEKIR